MQPYLSMITFSRNDDYGGGMLKRLRFTIDILIEQMEKYQIESELVIVDWNPPENKLKLHEALICPSRSQYLSVRVIGVPPAIHQRYDIAPFLPIQGAVAINAGLRRARGSFAVTRVSDIIWSDEIVSFISQKKLEQDTMYRLTRCDISQEILEHPEWLLSKKLEFCKNNVQTVMSKMKYYVKGLPHFLMNSDGDFQLLSLNRFRELRGYWESTETNSPNNDGLLIYCAHAAGIKDKLLKDVKIFKVCHGNSYHGRILSSIIPYYDIMQKIIPKSFLGPSFIKFSRMTGLSTLFYDNRVVKIGSIFLPTRKDYYDWCKQIVNRQKSYILNDDTWGLGADTLQEHQLMKAAWDKNI